MESKNNDSRGNRTAKSLKNIVVAVSFMLVNLLLQFFTRKIFLDRLGSEILGLNSTASNLLQFLNLAELGIGAAVGFSLYKPLFDGDRKTIREIVALQGHLYRRIAMAVIAGAVILGAFFPLIFADMTLPLWYAYASFGVLLFSALLSYFVNYKEIVLSADQKEYKIMYSYRAVMMSRLLVQSVCVWWLENPYIWWLVTEGLFTLLASVALNRMIYKTYPFLREKVERPSELRRKYPTIVIKIRQVFFHKMCTFVLQQSSPLIIAFIASLTMVTYYTNYMYVVTGIGIMLNALFNGINAGVGNLVAEGDRRNMLRVFGELFAVRFFICITLAVCLVTLSQQFITIWVGPEYLLPTSTLILIAVIFFFSNNYNSIDSFIWAFGLVHDIWAPVTESVISVGLAVLLGHFYGLDGILAGSLISILLIKFLWKPWFLFHSGLRSGIRPYVWLYTRCAAAAGIAVFVLAKVLEYVRIPVTGYTTFALDALLNVCVFGGTLLLAMCSIVPEIRLFLVRMAGRFVKR